tara:strand:+ start:41 stop:487 length:447 start_codon:yes stop_codon:yes gene_type:complete
MAERSKIAKSRMVTNLREEYQKQKKKLEDKFKGRGTSGKAEFEKRMIALENKFNKKFEDDRAMTEKYGKDAYKSQSFGVPPSLTKIKNKPETLKKRQGVVGRKSEVLKKKMKIKKPRFLHGVEAKIGRMRGGGLARSGAASLSGYKVR